MLHDLELYEYDKWNEKKKAISHHKKKPRYFNTRDIWWAVLGKNIGKEVYGKGTDFVRPVIILRVINSDSVFAIPLTSKPGVDNKWQLSVSVKEGKRVAMLNQLRVISTHRLVGRFGKISVADFQAIKKQLCELVFDNPHPAQAGVEELPEGDTSNVEL